RAGVYASPRRVSVGQQISQDELRERLLRAGYIQGRREGPPGKLSSGVFIIEGDATRFRSNSFDRAANDPETVNIKFNRRNGSRIVKIEDAATGAVLESAALPPESLTAESGSTTLPRGMGIHSRFEDFPPPLVNALISIEDRNFFSHRGVDVKAIV